jgi:phospholipid/cholesterol/gamma-HCH transport system permease protein
MSIESRAASRVALGIPRRLRRLLRAIGEPVLHAVHAMLLALGVAFEVVRQACRPINWRHSVRAEFHRALKLAGPATLPTILVTASVVGLAMVYQALYWLQIAGEITKVGRVLVLVLARDLAPVLVGLIILGRCGTVALVELGAMLRNGQVRRLEAMGIDPLIYLVMPRVIAMAIGTFALAILFIAIALTVGYMAGFALGAIKITLWGFLNNFVLALEARDYIVFPIKTLAIGFATGLSCCFVALQPGRAGSDITTLLPRGFVRAVLALLLVESALALTL